MVCFVWCPYEPLGLWDRLVTAWRTGRAIEDTQINLRCGPFCSELTVVRVRGDRNEQSYFYSRIDLVIRTVC